MSVKGKGKYLETIDLTQQNAFRPGAGAKKLVIKNLRPAAVGGAGNKQTELYYERTRQELKDAMDATFHGRAVTSPLERLYRGVEDICRRGEAEGLYKMLQEMCEHHLRRDVLQSIIAEGGATNVQMVRSVLSHWQIWNKQVVRRHPSVAVSR